MKLFFNNKTITLNELTNTLSNAAVSFSVFTGRRYQLGGVKVRLNDLISAVQKTILSSNRALTAEEASEIQSFLTIVKQVQNKGYKVSQADGLTEKKRCFIERILTKIKHLFGASRRKKLICSLEKAINRIAPIESTVSNSTQTQPTSQNLPVQINPPSMPQTPQPPLEHRQPSTIPTKSTHDTPTTVTPKNPNQPVQINPPTAPQTPRPSREDRPPSTTPTKITRDALATVSPIEKISLPPVKPKVKIPVIVVLRNATKVEYVQALEKYLESLASDEGIALNWILHKNNSDFDTTQLSNFTALGRLMLFVDFDTGTSGRSGFAGPSGTYHDLEAWKLIAAGNTIHVGLTLAQKPATGKFDFPKKEREFSDGYPSGVGLLSNSPIRMLPSFAIHGEDGGELEIRPFNENSEAEMKMALAFIKRKA